MAEKTIKIKVDKTGAQRSLDQINKTLGKVGLKADISKSSVDGANTSMGKMIPIMSNVALGLGAVGAAATAGAAALVSFTRQNTLAIKEMEKSARLAGLNAQAFQAYSYAANSVGVSQEKLGGILKDVNDRVGEFIAEGGGEFKFIFEELLQPIGITTDALKEMSSAEVLGAVQKGLDSVNADAKLTTTTYERLANDATLLQPLLENNGKALKELSKEASDFGLIITQDQIESAKEFNRQFELLEKQTTIFGQSISAELAEPMKELVKLSGLLLSSLSQTFEIGLNAKIENKKQEISELELALFERISSGAKKFGDVSVLDALNPFSTDTGDTDAMTADLQKLRKELELLESQKKKIDDSISNGAGGDSGGGGGGDSKDKLIEYLKAEIERLKSAPDGGSNDNQDKDLERRKQYLQSWIDNVSTYNMSATELNDAWRQRELEKLEEWRALNLDKEEEYNSAFFDINKKWAAKNVDIKRNKSKQDLNVSKQEARDLQMIAIASNQALDSLANAAEGRSDTLNSIVKGAAVFQATANMWLAASQAMADPTALTPAQKFANYAAMVSAGGGLLSSLNNLSPSRQTGGYMNSNTPYQVGGGAHSTDPEIYSSGGKDYLIDSSAGKMTRLGNGGGSSAMGQVNFQLINNGQPVDAQVTSDSVDEQGVRRIVAEMTPQIMGREMGDKYSVANQARKRWEQPQESYS